MADQPQQDITAKPPSLAALIELKKKEQPKRVAKSVKDKIVKNQKTNVQRPTTNGKRASATITIQGGGQASRIHNGISVGISGLPKVNEIDVQQIVATAIGFRNAQVSRFKGTWFVQLNHQKQADNLVNTLNGKHCVESQRNLSVFLYSPKDKVAQSSTITIQ